MTGTEKTKQPVKLNKTFIDNYELPVNTERVDIYDSELKGYGIRISKGKKSFFVMKYIGNKRTRVTIGPYPVFTAETARKYALEIMGDMSKGIDPNERKKESRIKGITIEEVFKQYLEENTLKDTTKRTYKDLINNHLGDWLKIPLSDLTSQMVIKRHKELSDSIGKNTANNAMRVLRAQYNYWYGVTDGKFSHNPINALNVMKKWNKIDRRKTYIAPHQFPAWFVAVNSLENSAMRDYLLLLMFTGLRKEEGLSMEWRNVDFHGKTFTVKDTKNGKDHTLPMSKYLHTLFKTRQKESGRDTYVFPGEGKKGYMQEPKRAVKAVRESSNVTFCLHDLRRSYISLASGLVSLSILKNLANHAEGKDVTEGYIVIDLEKLRKPMETISQTILSMATAPTEQEQSENSQNNN